MCQKYTYAVTYYVSGEIESKVEADKLPYREANRMLRESLRKANTGSVEITATIVDGIGIIPVMGVLTTRVKAYSEKEALSSPVASKLISEADFGELKNIRIYGKGAVRIDNKKAQVIGR